MRLVVIDTNIVVSAIIGKGNPRRVLETIFSGNASLCLSDQVFHEYLEVLSRPKFARYPEFYQAAQETLQHLASLSRFIHPTQQLSLCRDPGDNKFLELALASHAPFLVTGNKKHFPPGSFRGTAIVSAAEFVRTMIGEH